MPTSRNKFLHVIALACAATGAYAQHDVPDGVDFGASQQLVHDSNLYRLASGIEPASGARSDLVSITRISADLHQRIGLQTLAAGLGLAATRYRDNGQLDYESVDANARWDWVVGRMFDGTVALTQTQTLGGFEDFSGQQRSVNTHRRVEFVGDHRLSPSWFWGVGAAYTTNEYSDDTRPAAEYRARGLSLRAGYRGAAGERVTLGLGRTFGEYPNRIATVFADQNYQQNELKLSARWSPGGATRLSGYLGMLSRSYDFAPNRDFDGVVGRLEMDWQPSGKLVLTTVVRREIGAQEDLVDNFVVTDSLALRPRWLITDKIDLGPELELRRRDYGGDPGFGVVGTVDRKERLRRLGLVAAYRPTRAFSIGGALRWESRSSHLDTREFSERSASVSAAFSF